jgi:hypothetical protein
MGTNYRARLRQRPDWDPEAFREAYHGQCLDRLRFAWRAAADMVRAEFMAEVGLHSDAEEGRGAGPPDAAQEPPG